MNTLEIDLGERSYPVLVGDGLLAGGEAIAPALGRRSLVITSETVAGLYLGTLTGALGGHEFASLVLPDGDAAKTLAHAERVCGAASDAGIGRDGTFIALGGGAVCDVAGFSASVYQRGVGCIQVPTTLLAQVDASVGGKTAVNHPRAKNLIGTFHQPRRVIADVGLLRTLPARELSSGLAEVIKVALLGDAAMLDWLEDGIGAMRGGDEAALTEAVLRCCRHKAAIVAADETEQGGRVLLNLGHTFGHALEVATERALSHGESVAIGCAMAAGLSRGLGWIGADEVKRVERLMASAGLPVRPPPGVDAETLLGIMQRDKKVSGGRLVLVLLKVLGEAFATADYPHAALVLTLREYCA